MASWSVLGAARMDVTPCIRPTWASHPIFRTICRFGAVSGRRTACNADNGLDDPEFRLSWRRIMLVLSRKTGEKVITSNGITVTVAEIKGNRVRLGFQAQDEVKILRA